MDGISKRTSQVTLGYSLLTLPRNTDVSFHPNRSRPPHTYISETTRKDKRRQGPEQTVSLETVPSFVRTSMSSQTEVRVCATEVEGPGRGTPHTRLPSGPSRLPGPGVSVAIGRDVPGSRALPSGRGVLLPLARSYEPSRGRDPGTT